MRLGDLQEGDLIVGPNWSRLIITVSLDSNDSDFLKRTAFKSLVFHPDGSILRKDLWWRRLRIWDLWEDSQSVLRDGTVIWQGETS